MSSQIFSAVSSLMLLRSEVSSPILRTCSCRPAGISGSRQSKGSISVIAIFKWGLNKNADNVSIADFKGLKEFQSITGNDFVCGAILYRDCEVIPFGEKLWAVPVGNVWK